MATTTWNVAPRYTGGSPAMVPPHIAERVAVQERESYAHYLEGVYGEHNTDKAKAEGLALIVFTMRETRTGWEVYDVITEERHFWPFKATCPTCGAKRVSCRRGWLDQHVFKGGSGYCVNRSYVGYAQFSG